MHEHTMSLDMAITDHRKEGLGNEKRVDSLGVAGSNGYHLDISDYAFPGCSRDAEIGGYLNVVEHELIVAIYDMLSTFEPCDPGPDIRFRVRREKRYRVGRTRLYVPTGNDEYEAAYWGGYNMRRERTAFVERFVSVSELYVTSRNEFITGRELLEKHGCIVGNDAVDAVSSFLESGRDILSFDQCARLAGRFGVSRGTLAAIFGPWATVHYIKRKGSQRHAFLLRPIDPFN